LDRNDADRYFVDFSQISNTQQITQDEIVLLINNLGGVSNFVLSSLAQLTLELLEKNYKIKPKQVLVGTLMTAFNGEGFSITLLNASTASSEIQKQFPEIESVFDLLNAPTDAPAWPTYSFENAPQFDQSLLEEEITTKASGLFDFNLFTKIMEAGSKALIEAEPHITHLDSQVGDGDCGYTLVAGANGILKELPMLKEKKLSFSETLAYISEVIESSMGGTSGGLYSIFVSGITAGILQYTKENEQVDKLVLAKALKTGMDTLFKYTKARRGDSTLIDALEPFVLTFLETKGDFVKALEEADKGAQSTGHAEAKFGRASYVGNSTNIPDPGAVGFVEFLKGVQNAL